VCHASCALHDAAILVLCMLIPHKPLLSQLMLYLSGCAASSCVAHCCELVSCAMHLMSLACVRWAPLIRSASKA
jgi:hypothetical protein